jgi:uncharacterized protein YndB with AHSA1/START domain
VNEITSSTHIAAPIDAVWGAITTPSAIKQWFFGVDTRSDWKVGSQLVHTGEYKGKPYVDKGEIIEFEPPRRLVHSHWSDVSGKPDHPEHYQVVAWELVEKDGGTELTIRERNLPSEDAATTSEDAWTAALGSLKTMLERRPPYEGSARRT